MGDLPITALVAALEDYKNRKLDMASSAKREAAYSAAMSELDAILAALTAAKKARGDGADLSDMRDALIAAHRFVQEERENRESAGGDMTDYVGEARAVEDLIAGALGIVEPEAADSCPLPGPQENTE